MSTRRAAQSIDEFSKDHGIGRSTTYREIKEGRLRILKVGRRTLITAEAGAAWRDQMARIGESQIALPKTEDAERHSKIGRAD